MKMGHYLPNILLILRQAQESRILLKMMERSMNGILCLKNQLHQQLSRLETSQSNKIKKVMIIMRIHTFLKKINKGD